MHLQFSRWAQAAVEMDLSCIVCEDSCRTLGGIADQVDFWKQMELPIKTYCLANLPMMIK